MTRFAALLVLLNFGVGFPMSSADETTSADEIASADEAIGGREKRIVAAIETTIGQAGGEFRADRFAESGESIRRAMKQIEVAMKVASPAMFDAMTPSMDRIETAHALLELEGVTLPPFRRPGRPEANPSESGPDEGSMSETPPGESVDSDDSDRSDVPDVAEEISFVRHVAPILRGRCGRCHIDQTRGGFAIGSYAALMRGTREGRVVFPGDVIASRLIETIETGDMPRGGGSVPGNELATLKAWILAGAKFDGTDPNAPLPASPLPSDPDGSPSATDEPTMRRPSGSETVSFAADVAPLLVDNCRGCHLDANRASGGLRMDNFAQLLRGGDTGPVIVPGNGEQSLLVRKLRGNEGQRMPAGGRPPLSDGSIALISTWIDEGATLDGADESQPLTVMSQLAWAASASTEEKSERRQEIAGRSLKLALGQDAPPERITSDHFLTVGTVGEATLRRVSESAEGLIKEVRRTVPGVSGGEYFAGRATIFVLPRRYDYSEFAKMVEGRGVPADWSAHWRFDGIDAYVALVVAEADDDDAIEGRLLGPLTSLAIATKGTGVPRWFAEGVGRAVSVRESPPRDRSARREWEAETVEAIKATKTGARFLEGKVTPEQADRVGAAVAGSLLDRPFRRGFDQLLRHLDSGAPFDEAFVASFGGMPVDFLDRWLGRPPARN